MRGLSKTVRTLSMLPPQKTLLAARVRRGTLQAVLTAELVRCHPTACSRDTSLARSETPTCVGLRRENNNKGSTTTKTNLAPSRPFSLREDLALSASERIGATVHRSH